MPFYNYNINENVRCKLKDLRESQNLSQQKLADNLNKEFGNIITQGTISRLETGVREVPNDIIYYYSKYFNVSSDYILGLVKEPTNDKDKSFVCEYTGLSKDAIDYLHNNYQRYKEQSIPIISLNYFFSKNAIYYFNQLLKDFHMHRVYANQYYNYRNFDFNSAKKRNDKEYIGSVSRYNEGLLKANEDEYLLNEYKIQTNMKRIVQAYCSDILEKIDELNEQEYQFSKSK